MLLLGKRLDLSVKLGYNLPGLGKALLNLYYYPLFFVITVACLLLLPLYQAVAILLAPLMGPPDRTLRWGICLHGWLLTVLVPFFAPVRVENYGVCHSHPMIITPNHHSSIDPYLFGSLFWKFKKFRTLAFITSWPFNIPIFKWVMSFSGYIHAGHGWEKMVSQGRYLLKNDSCLVIWPEGHRSRNGQMRRFKNGAFRLAVQTGTPVLPVCILGSGSLLPPGKRLFNPAQVKLVLLPPIFPSEWQNYQSEEQAVVWLKNKTYACIAQEVIRLQVIRQQDNLTLNSQPS